MRLSTKILMPVAILSAVAAIVTITALWSKAEVNRLTDRLSRVNQAALTASELRSTSRALQRDALNLIFEPAESRAEIDARFGKRLADLREQIAALEAAAATDGTDMVAMAAKQHEVATALEGVRTMVMDGKAGEAHALFRGRLRRAERSASELTDPYITDLTALAAGMTAELRTLEASTRWILLIIALGGTAGGIALSLLVAVGGVTRPLSRLTGAMQRLAENDLSVRLTDDRRSDELGAMARAVAVFRDGMARAADLATDKQRERAAREARRQARDLLMREFVASMDAIAADLAHDADGLQRDAGGLQQVATRAAERTAAAADASNRTAANVQTVASATEELSASISEISRQAGLAANRALEGADDARSTASDIDQLAQTVAGIAEIVDLIDGIAAQTNLLALNATIEAARAGEAGKGFAVVASEVKTLATQTGGATEDIRRRVSGIQGATRGAVAAIDRIVTAIDNIRGMNVAIAAAVEEQAAATAEITRNVQSAASGTEDVRHDLDDLCAVADRTGAASTSVNAAAAGVADRTGVLRGNVAKLVGRLEAA